MARFVHDARRREDAPHAVAATQRHGLAIELNKYVCIPTSVPPVATETTVSGSVTFPGNWFQTNDEFMFVHDCRGVFNLRKLRCETQNVGRATKFGTQFHLGATVEYQLHPDVIDATVSFSATVPDSNVQIVS